MFCTINCTPSQTKEEAPKEDRKENVIVLAELDPTYWSSSTPIAFLDRMAKCAGDTIFMVDKGPPAEWFDPAYIPQLSARLNDNTPSSFIFSINENNIHGSEISTVACQAQYLLDSYANQKYPLYLCSFHYAECAE